MKISYRHLVRHIEDRPSIEHISNKLFQLGHEHEIDGDIFDMEFTPNRGDCLSINGLLRDLAVFYTVDLKQEIFTEKLNELQLDFENLSESVCPKISFLKLEIEQIPETYEGSLDNYFQDLGLNKNNFFTDLSNYLSYETGQPTHCYDANTINNKLVFHEIEKNEEFETLLGKKVILKGKNAVFSLNNEVISLAGVVGGKSTSCSAHTKTVIVECAFFQPEAIIGKSVKYDIRSEASHKFERGVDPEGQDKVLRRFIKLVSEHTNIKSMSITSYKYIDNLVHLIPVDVHKINQIIGLDISETEYLMYLIKLGFVVDRDTIIVPSFRSDVRTQNDLAEELARVIGYDNLPRLEINIPKSEKPNYNDIENRLRHFLLDHGFYEVINSPFVSISSDEAIKVDNPLDSNREFIRTNATHSLLNNLLFNERRQKDSIKLFEISDIYYSNSGIDKKRVLSVIASGRVGLNYKEFSNKINKQYLLEIFKEITTIDNLNIQVISRDSLDSKVKSEILSIEIEINSLSKNILLNNNQLLKPKNFIQYKPVSEYPSSNRDISFLIKDSTKIKDLLNVINEYSNEILKQVFVFDYYKNIEIKQIKIGFRFIFQSSNKTLKVDEIDLVLSDVIKRTTSIDSIEIPGI
jgi:phenylalanyl-tRNA synthetase beta chain